MSREIARFPAGAKCIKPCHVSGCFGFLLGQESCRTKVSRIFRIFVPNFAPNFAPNFPRIFSRIFRASFRGKRRPEKIHQKSPPFLNAKCPGRHEKYIHKIFLQSRQSKFLDLSQKLRGLFLSTKQGVNTRLKGYPPLRPKVLEVGHLFSGIHFYEARRESSFQGIHVCVTED